MDNSIYLECRDIIKTFLKNDYWNHFTSADVFYIVDNKGNRSMITFLDAFFGESFGIQLFNNRDGFNYVHDIFTIDNPDIITIGDCDSICAVLVSKKDLKPHEIKYLKDKKIRIRENNNLILYRFEKGYAHRLASKKEEREITEYLGFLSCLINNDFDDIKEAFNNEYAAVVNLDKINLQYSVIYRPLPYLERLPKKSPVNVPFYEEFKDSVYVNDEIFCYSSYLPVIVKETNVRPLIVYFYYPKSGKALMRYIIDKPKDYKSCIWGLLYDVFSELGLPAKIIFKSRDLYFPVVKTLEKLNVETSLSYSNINVDTYMGRFASSIYSKTKDESFAEKEVLELLMDSVSNYFENYEFEESDDDIDIDEEVEYVS